MPVNVKFNSKDIVRPPKPTQEGQTFMLILDRDSIGVNNSSRKEPTSMSVIEKIINVCLIREVINSGRS